MAFKDVLIDFGQWTAAHGMPRIAGAANNIWRIFWILVTVGCVAMLSWNLYMVVVKFISYLVTVSPSFKFDALAFPSITVCNLNSFMMSKVMNITTPFGHMVNDYSIQFAAITNKNYVNTTSPLWPIWNLAANNDTTSLQNQAAQSVAYAAGVVNRSDYASSPSISYMVLSCTYDTVACKSSDWTSIDNYFYNTCYKYNGQAIYTSVRAGPANGLRVMFRTDQLDYMPWVVSAGVKIMIHNGNENPFPVAFGYTAPVGIMTSIAVKRTTKIRLPKPYGSCITSKGGRSYYYSGDYTIEGCIRSCMQDKIIKICGCANAMYTGPSSSSVCNFNISSQYFCALSTVTSFDTSICDCPEICEQNSFTVTVATTSWPAPRFIPSFCYKTPFVRGDNVSYWITGNTTDCMTWFSMNTGLFEVFYETLDARNLIETEAYPLLSLISDFGGQMGLWIGGSFIVIFEFLAFFVLIILFIVSKCMRCCKGKNQVANEPEKPGEPGDPEKPENQIEKPKNPNHEMYDNDHGSDVIPPGIAQPP